MVDCVNGYPSQWAVSEEVHWVLKDPRPLSVPVTDVMGKLGLWSWTCPILGQAPEEPFDEARARLIRDFTRLTRTPEETALEVAVVSWNGPHTPVLKWQTFQTWRGDADAEEISAEKRTVLKDPRFFCICDKCGELNNKGHMHNQHLCQGCAERHYNVVY